jgi:hypothetical protein
MHMFSVYESIHAAVEIFVSVLTGVWNAYKCAWQTYLIGMSVCVNNYFIGKVNLGHRLFLFQLPCLK